jgi:hypothetical protein
LRIVSSQNPPGGQFSDREILDPAQFTRFTFIKEASKMPPELKRARAMGFLGVELDKMVGKSTHLTTKQSISAEELKADPKFKEIMGKILEFEEAVEELTENHTIGGEQAQPIYFAFQRDLKKLLQFVQRYHDGDHFSTVRRALHYYYVNRFESQMDRDKVRELVNTALRPTPPVQPEHTSFHIYKEGQDGGEDLKKAA